ncbi:MAG: quinolinate synthase NadA [Euryarchaeota archaeon]|nr:MAG: Quinolinate synthase A [ANME-2 cluster archaeon]MEA1864244.1 quinolinate synthase NadA [Euryarchaeota archaeon]
MGTIIHYHHHHYHYDDNDDENFREVETMQNNIDTGYMERIERLKREKNAVILAHNYERPEIRAVADVVSGSLGLTEAANETSADIIVVCGVNFMAEMAAVMNPDRKIISPLQNAVCPLAEQLSPRKLLDAKRTNPNSEVLLYMSAHASVIALADCVCTAANALTVAGTMDHGSPVLFGPDRGVSYYISKRTGRELIAVPENGACPVHHKISLESLIAAKAAHPGAKVVAHPECRPEVQDHTDYVGSTDGILRFCKEDDAGEFLVATDSGVSHMLETESPEKTFYPISADLVCPRMKVPTLAKLEAALSTEKFRVVVPREIADAARMPIERMLELS